MPAALDTMTIQREPLMPLWDEAAPMMAQHAAESPVAGEWALDPDLGTYARSEAAGAVRCYTVRVDGGLVGYAVFFICKHLRHRHLTVASHDTLYVAPAHRGATGLSLLAYAHRELRAEGVDLVSHSADDGTPFHDLLDRLGYARATVTYTKRLGRTD